MPLRARAPGHSMSAKQASLAGCPLRGQGFSALRAKNDKMGYPCDSNTERVDRRSSKAAREPPDLSPGLTASDGERHSGGAGMAGAAGGFAPILPLFSKIWHKMDEMCGLNNKMSPQTDEIARFCPISAYIRSIDPAYQRFCARFWKTICNEPAQQCVCEPSLVI
jgi:hypothetical protein